MTNRAERLRLQTTSRWSCHQLVRENPPKKGQVRDRLVSVLTYTGDFYKKNAAILLDMCHFHYLWDIRPYKGEYMRTILFYCA